jgi:hypothetical protein
MVTELMCRGWETVELISILAIRDILGLLPNLPPANNLSFQQHSRLKRLIAFVFIDIPASPPSFP